MQAKYYSVFHGFRDILRAPAQALSAKQILVMTLFLMASVAVYNVLTYLSFMIDGQRLSVVFSAYGFFPFELPGLGGTFAWIVYAVGVLVSILVLMLGFFAVSAINIEKIRGNRFLSIGGAMKFAFSRFKQIFLAELSILVFIGFIIFLFFLVGLASRIPGIGEWLYAIFFAVPSFVVGLLTVFMIFVFTLTVLLLPAVAAAERTGEVFGVILETFSTIIRQPFRWFTYTGFAIVAAKLASFVYAYFCFRALQFVVGASMLGGGERLDRMVKAGLSHLPASSEFVRETCNVFPGIDWSFSIAHWTRASSSDPVGYVMAAMILVIFASVVGYALATIAAGQAHGFVAIRYIKDDYDIAEEDSLFFTDEHVNPEISDEPKSS